MRDFREVKAWGKAHQLTLAVYRITRGFPADEKFGLTSQMRRASSSIGANIAEGCGRRGDAELSRFLQISYASASELEYHVLLSYDLGYLHKEDHHCLHGGVVEVNRMLASFIRKMIVESRPIRELS